VGGAGVVRLHLGRRRPGDVLAIPQAPSLPELAELGVARISYGSLLHRQSMEQFNRSLTSIAADAAAMTK
jgi:2-methylisocitrate lyase-like PEP mutase family enzyme